MKTIRIANAKMKITLLNLLFLFIFTQCEGDGASDPVVTPSNLQVQIEVSNDGSGKVDVTATAENANYFYIYFKEADNEIPAVALDGIATHTYLNSGSYSIKVEAYANPGHFISKTALTVVTVNENIVIPETGYTTPLTYAGMNLAWADEFDGATLNTNDWTFETGTGGSGWGNNELEYYRAENTSLKDGMLIITARKQSYSGSSYTSSRIKTQGKKDFLYGRVDIRAVLPEGQGIWPALWMLGANIGAAGWPACGEIDIMEMIGGSNRENTVFGTVHWDNSGHVCSCGKPGSTLSSGTFNDEFHVFSIVWTASSITWYVDDVEFNTVDISPANMSELRANQFFIFNVAVGGNWPGSPDASTVFPQAMIVDYIRVFQPN